MKNLIIYLLLIISFAAKTHAFQEEQTNINIGFGGHGNRGVLGITFDKLLTEHHALSASAGLDTIGAITSVGFKYIGTKLTKHSDSAWGKCFFIWECDSYLFAGGGIQYATGTTIEISENSIDRTYQTKQKWLGITSLGFKQLLKNSMTFDIEISYRQILTGGEYTQTKGSYHDDTKAIESGYRTVGINFGIGYLF